MKKVKKTNKKNKKEKDSNEHKEKQEKNEKEKNKEKEIIRTKNNDDYNQSKNTMTKTNDISKIKKEI